MEAKNGIRSSETILYQAILFETVIPVRNQCSNNGYLDEPSIIIRLGYSH